MEVAKAAFTELGPDVALEEIARRADVGIGTLYRHFPTRDALLAEVYRHAVEQLAETAERLSEDARTGRGAARLDAAVRGLYCEQTGDAPRPSARWSAAHPRSTPHPAQR